MGHTYWKQKTLIAFAAFTGLTGCLAEEKTFGYAAGYVRSYPAPIVLDMPANAPSITQQFRGTLEVSTLEGIDEHFGIDVHAPIGTPVIAAAGGVVERSFWGPAYGNQVQIRHAPDASGKSSRTRYVHLHKRLVAQGDVLERGEQLGELGVTGFLSSGFPHLHFELIYQGTALGTSSADPHRFWAQGRGKITCMGPEWADISPETFKLTYPVPCK
ncbi:M23 family metallopeptidase [Cognatishimia sp. SS12]|uniref:M23 family metallopeptidase n=1 Tax=Cognatishimia sp. SS12 TaxID=2979465 RepID=UPI00232DA5A3|nr:M23 family metallopeptidase [Cognatishimia sp. SS12]MDC0736889.1 M23 family metallopeptidase [Cognatishimia sp. SS12]